MADFRRMAEVIADGETGAKRNGPWCRYCKARVIADGETGAKRNHRLSRVGAGLL